MSLLQLPLPAQALVSQKVGEGDGAYHVRELRAHNPAQRLTAAFAADGVTVRAGGDLLRLALSGARVEPIATLNRVEYRREAMTEWYANGPLGLEQGFTLESPLGGPLRLEVSGTLEPRLVGGDVAFGDVLELRGLYAEDADGQLVPSWFELVGGTLLVHVDDSSARYPVTVDPFIAQTKVTAFDGMRDDHFGTAVAVAGDTLVVGAPLDDTRTTWSNDGSAYIFVKAGAGWSLERKLTASDAGINQNFGASVAIDGDTAVIGSAGGAGGVYVFVRTGTTWSEQAKLTRSDGVASDYFGGSVAIAGDTVAALDSNAGAVPGVVSSPGAVYVFTRTGTVWHQQAKITASGGGLVRNLALDADTIVARGFLKDASGEFTPVAYVFVRGGTTWAQQAMLTGADPTPEFGRSVDVSGDTVVVGDQLFNIAGATNAGAAYVFVRHGGSWTEQARLLNPEPATNEFFGAAVAITGNTAVVTTPYDDTSRGSVFVFVRTGVVWTKRAKLTAADGAPADYLGTSVAVTGDAIAAGAYLDDTGRGFDTGSVTVFPFAETDGDGLLDSWETNGLDVDGDGTIDVDLPAMGADPDRKDVFVEIDSMTGHKLSQQALDIVIASFAAAPVANPDGTTGITLHVDNGANSVMDPMTGARWGLLSDADTLTHVALLGTEPTPDTYDWTAFDALRDANFQEARKRVFHYTISAHAFSAGGYSGIARGVPASNLIVSLGSFCSPGQECSGTVTDQAGTFMHELGHDLGLGHGGGDDLNNKPNYFSVMNYDFQLWGLIPVGTTGPGVFDYSSFTSPAVDPIDETALDETKSFGHGAGLDYWAVYRCPASGVPPVRRLVRTEPLDAVDWNCDGDSTDTALAADVNGDGRQGTLRPFDDWSHIVFTGGSIGALGDTLPAEPTETAVIEPTIDQLLTSAAAFDDPVELASSTATSVHDTAHGPVAAVEAGSAVHGFVTVTGQPSSPSPTGSVTIDWFLNGSCSGAPAQTGGPFALDASGQVDATAFSLTASVGQRSFQARYAGNDKYAASDGACAVLTVVDANVQISPPTATNPIATNQPLTITVNASGGLIDPGTHSATASISSGPGSFVGSPTCTYTGGAATATCQVMVTSAVAGTTVVATSADIQVSGVGVMRTSGTAANTAAGGSNNATNVWLQPDEPPATPPTVPGAPTGVSGTPGNAQVVLTWSAPTSNGGAAIVDFTATSSPGGASCTTRSLTCTISGLTAGTAYTFTVVATNAAGAGAPSAPSAAVVPLGPGFAPLQPGRLFDTRPTDPQGAVVVAQRRYGGAGNILRVKVAGALGIPLTGVGAVSLNVTVVDPTGPGFVTVYPCGERPLAANLNYVARQIVPNAVIAPVSASGEVCFFSFVEAFLIADVNGWFAAGSSFNALSPLRAFDTRPTDPQGAVSVTKQRYGGDGQILRVKLTGVAGVPATGVGAVSLNVTVADPVGPGFVTVFPCGQRPLAANLNYIAGQIVPNAVIAPVSPEGEVCFFSLAGAHLIADVNGWFKAGSAFNSVTPQRIFDTRPTDPQGAVSVTKQRYGGEVTVLKVKVTGAAGVPTSGVGAVSLNVTVVDPVASGFVTVFPCGTRPLAANLNYVAGQIVPNAVIAPVSAAGEVCFFSLVDAHLIADVNGWFSTS